MSPSTQPPAALALGGVERRAAVIDAIETNHHGHRSPSPCTVCDSTARCDCAGRVVHGDDGVGVRRARASPSCPCSVVAAIGAVISGGSVSPAALAAQDDVAAEVGARRRRPRSASTAPSSGIARRSVGRGRRERVDRRRARRRARRRPRSTSGPRHRHARARRSSAPAERRPASVNVGAVSGAASADGPRGAVRSRDVVDAKRASPRPASSVSLIVCLVVRDDEIASARAGAVAERHGQHRRRRVRAVASGARRRRRSSAPARAAPRSARGDGSLKTRGVARRADRRRSSPAVRRERGVVAASASRGGTSHASRATSDSSDRRSCASVGARRGRAAATSAVDLDALDRRRRRAVGVRGRHREAQLDAVVDRAAAAASAMRPGTGRSGGSGGPVLPQRGRDARRASSQRRAARAGATRSQDVARQIVALRRCRPACDRRRRRRS